MQGAVRWFLFSLAVLFGGHSADAFVPRSCTAPELRSGLLADFANERTYPVQKLNLTLDPRNGLLCNNQPLGNFDPIGLVSINEIGADLNRILAEDGAAAWLYAIPGALWDFTDPFDPTSPATMARHKLNGEAIPNALAEIDAANIPQPIKVVMKFNIGFGLAGNAANPFNAGVDFYDLGTTIRDIGFKATAEGMVRGISEQPAVFAGGLPIVIITGKGGNPVGFVRRSIRDADILAAKTEANFVNLASPQRTTHILTGDATGGGHLFPGGAGKSPFPQSWSADRVMHEISDVATDPLSVFTSGRGGRTIVTGSRDGIDLKVILGSKKEGGGIITGFPTNVPRNP